MKLFAAQCPINDELRAWIEKSSSWLVRALEIKLEEVVVVLPTSEFFPDLYRARDEDVDKLLRRVCGYMGIDRERLSLELFSDEHKELRSLLPSFESHGRGTAGQYRKDDAGSITIRLNASDLNNPMVLVATIAHELGHVLLLADGKVSHERNDHEYLTDLVTVLLGLGIFSANSSFKFRQWSGGFRQGWESRRLGYMNEPMFGYSLAWFAFLRKEHKPDWSKYLEADARHYFKSSARFLEKTVT
jgi:hypothetical protein